MQRIPIQRMIHITIDIPPNLNNFLIEDYTFIIIADSSQHFSCILHQRKGKHIKITGFFIYV